MVGHPEILVVGAGVIGLTTAIGLAETGHRVTVVAEEVPGRTSLAAGASWGPYHVEPHDKVGQWGRDTLAVLTELATVAGTGVRMVSGVEASRTAATMPRWASHLPAVRPCPSGELPQGFATGWRYTVPVVDMPRYLAYLLRRLRSAGGTVERRHVVALPELARGGRTVVNCAGLGAGALADDDSVYPIRGQLVVVANPGLHTFFSEDTGTSPELLHYLPHGDSMVLGGVAAAGDWSRDPDPATSAAIIARCGEIEPLLLRAEVLMHRVGLRPTRPQVRLEAERLDGTRVIHNYGHGGAGVSLSWGCAAETLALVAGCLDG